jgi:cytochrome b561
MRSRSSPSALRSAEIWTTKLFSSTTVSGQTPLRTLIGQNRPLAKQLLEVHETVGFLLLGLIALHASAALYHHFWRRDGTLEAMLPARMRRSQAPGGRKKGRVYNQW